MFQLPVYVILCLRAKTVVTTARGGDSAEGITLGGKPVCGLRSTRAARLQHAPTAARFSVYKRDIVMDMHMTLRCDMHPICLR